MTNRTRNETHYLEELAGQPPLARLGGHLRLSGPGYLQSAMTLGSGTIGSCVVMGSLLGYKLLWVQPLGMILGYFVLAAVAKQTCSTGARPYQVFWERLHPILAILWAVSALVATIIWHFPQYSLSANGIVTLAQGIGFDLNSAWARAAMGAVLLTAAWAMTYLYTVGARGLKAYELVTKILVWLIVLAFAAVAFLTGIRWKPFLLGITAIDFLRDLLAGEVPESAVRPIVSGLAAAVGINMLFLYPYTILSKNWGKNHQELAYFDLILGLVTPFMVATTFLIIGTANTIGPPPGLVGQEVRDIGEIIPVLAPTFGPRLSPFLMGLGMVAVGFSTIITHMLASGFIASEMFGFDPQGKARRWFALLPAVGVLGVAMPSPWYVAITASTLVAPLMPLAVLCFLILLNMASFIGEARPRGGVRLLWNAMLVSSILVMTVASYFSLTRNWEILKENRARASENAAAVQLEQDGPAAGEDLAEERKESEKMVGYETVRREAMATEFVFTIYTRPGDTGTGEILRIAEEAFAAVEDLEARISRWRPDSQTSYINNRAAHGPVRVAPDVLELILACKRLHQDTHGAFDVTVGPLIQLWGFYRGQGHLPTQKELEQTCTLVGLDKVRVDPEERTISFAKPGMLLDFGGIGKGLALDRAAEILRQYGVVRAILHSGTSTVMALGSPPGKPGWTVRIRNPYNSEEGIDEVPLGDGSLSTSGAYEKFFELEGKKYCHVFDPRTGKPVEGMLSATALAPTGVESDALSTAFFVLGVEGTQRYCRDHKGVRAVLAPVSEARKPEAMRIHFDSERG